MDIAFHPAKNIANLKKHGISLERAKDMDFDTAYYQIDASQDYGETRIIAVGFIGMALHVLVFADTSTPNTIRAISLRRASSTEETEYAENN